MSSCSSLPTETKNNDLLLSAVPSFPAPHSSVVGELKEVCPKDKCIKLYDWLGKLMVFEKQLKVLKDTSL